MKAKMAAKLVVLGVLIVLVGRLLRGHDILIGIALTILALLVAGKIIGALVWRRKGPPGGRGGGWSSNVPVPRPPNGRPPVLSAAADIK